MAMISTETFTHPTLGLTAAFKNVAKAFAVRKQRSALNALDCTRLEDIGISREQANLEASRSAWDVPKHWRA